MKRSGFKSRGKPLTAKKPMKKVSDKKRAYRASAEGREAMEYMGAVKMLPCVICGSPGPNDAHHCFHGRYGTRKASDFDVIALCRWDHLDGPQAIHRDKAGWMERNGPDHGYIEATREAVRALRR